MKFGATAPVCERKVGPRFRSGLEQTAAKWWCGADCSGAYSFHFSRSYMLAVALQAGDTLYAQYWSRDPGFAPPDDVGLTDAIQFTIAP